MNGLQEALAIGYLEAYISEFKRPDWLVWFGLYDQKARVEKAEKHLDALRHDIELGRALAAGDFQWGS
jgi:hypothetical protein